MIDIVGYIQIDESKQEEIQGLFKCIESYRFMEKHSNFFLKVKNCSEELAQELNKRLKTFKSFRVYRQAHDRYGDGILTMLYELPNTKYFIEFDGYKTLETSDYGQLLSWCEILESQNTLAINGVVKRECLESIYKKNGAVSKV